MQITHSEYGNEDFAQLGIARVIYNNSVTKDRVRINTNTTMTLL